VVFAGLATVVGLVGWLVVPRLIREVPQLINQLPQFLVGLADRAAAVFGNQSQLARQLAAVAQWLLELASQMWRYAGTLVASVILTIVLVAMSLFLVSNPRPLLRGYLRAMPPHLRAPAARAFARGSRMVVGWVTANLLLGAIKGVFTFVFLHWIGVDGVAVWTVLAVLSSLLPAVGFYLMAIPPSLLAAAENPVRGLWVLVFFWAMSEFLGDFIAPRLWEHTMRLHPVYLLFMVIASAATFGVVGVLIAIPLAGFLKTFFDEFYLLRQPEDADADEQIERILHGRT
jgi:predicted PurR-regulated permease PerM